MEWFRDDSFKLGVERGSSLLLTRHEEGSDEYRFSLVVEDFDAERDACVYTCLAANKLGVSSARVTVSGESVRKGFFCSGVEKFARDFPNMGFFLKKLKQFIFLKACQQQQLMQHLETRV